MPDNRDLTHAADTALDYEASVQALADAALNFAKVQDLKGKRDYFYWRRKLEFAARDHMTFLSSTPQSESAESRDELNPSNQGGEGKGAWILVLREPTREMLADALNAEIDYAPEPGLPVCDFIDPSNHVAAMGAYERNGTGAGVEWHTAFLTAIYRAAISASPSAPGAVDKEAWARIIDPEAAATMDRYAGQAITDKERRRWETSLAKADAIIALLTTPEK